MPSCGRASCIPLQDVERCRDLRCTASGATLLHRCSNDDAGQRSDAPGPVLAPAEVQAQPADAVERVLGVGLLQCLNSMPVTLAQCSRTVIVAAPGHTEPGNEVPAPSRLDFFQDG
jgi:hypothetical protein